MIVSDSREFYTLYYETQKTLFKKRRIIMKKSNLLKYGALALTAVAALATNYVNEKEQQKAIDEAVNNALEKKNDVDSEVEA